MTRFPSSTRAAAAPLASAVVQGPAATAGPFTFTPVVASGDTFDPFG